MPDLSTEAIQRWIDTYGQTTTDVDRKEGFRDSERHSGVEQALTTLGQVLEEARDNDVTALRTALIEDTGRDGLRRILAQLGPGRMARILYWLSYLGSPDADAVLTTLFDSSSDINVLSLRETLQVLHRRELLGRLFGEDRVGMLLSACRLVQKEAACWPGDI